MKWEGGKGEMAAYNLSVGNEAQSRRGSSHYFKPALTYTERTASRFSPRLLPAGAIFTGAGPAILPREQEDLLLQLAVFSSWCFAALYEVCLGTGDAVTSGAAARHYTSGLLGRMPFPQDVSALASHAEDLEAMLSRFVAAQSFNWTSPYTARNDVSRWASFDEAVRALTAELAASAARVIELSGAIEPVVAKTYGLEFNNESRVAISSIVGPHPDWLPDVSRDGTWESSVEAIRDLYALRIDQLVDRAANELGHARHLALKAYCADRRLELVSHILGVHPRLVAQAVTESGAIAPEVREAVAVGIVSNTMEALWGVSASTHEARHLEWRTVAFDPSNATIGVAGRTGADRIYCDDIGHAMDIADAFQAQLESRSSHNFASSLGAWIAGGANPWREYLARRLFAAHIATCSLHRRTAPQFWQLATPSASYSVWLYIHAFSKDTLFRVQNDYAAPKLAHEERRLESLTSELRDGATAAQRKALAAQESLVEELRAFLDEVKRVAPLWNPNLDDGVIINFAPLWRLVPQNKTWQKELKSTWDALCEGKYDWAHLAMHLWPERVVPKCAKDRSLAIAHGLEDVFWVEGTDGKWTARKTPTRSIDELVRERTSPAVKSALKSLLEAPVASGTSAGRKGGGRRKAAAVAEGGDA